jgi:hypothetical protein
MESPSPKNRITFFALSVRRRLASFWRRAVCAPAFQYSASVRAREIVSYSFIKTQSSHRILPMRVHLRFEAFTAVIMTNAVFWDIKIKFVLHRRYITSPLQRPAR